MSTNHMKKKKKNNEIINYLGNENKNYEYFSIKKINFDSIVHCILFCEIYSDKISKLISIINIIINFFPQFNINDLQEIIINLIKDNKSKIKAGKKFGLNEIFYLIIESFLIYISNEIIEINSFNEYLFYDYLRDFIVINEIVEQLFLYFKLTSIEFYNINIISQLIKEIRNNPELNCKKDIISQFLINVMILLNEEKELLIRDNLYENNVEEINHKLMKNFRDFFSQIDNMYNRDDKNKDIINKIKLNICRIQINKIKNNDNYIQDIIFTIFNDEDLIIHSEIFIELLLPKKYLIPYIPSEKNTKKNCKENFMNYFKNIDKINQKRRANLYKLNNSQSSVLEESLLFYFDKIFKKFLFYIEEQINIKFNNKIYDDIPLEYFKICCEDLQNIINENRSSISDLTNLIKLYSISYIKNFLNIYVNHIIKEDNLWNRFSFNSFHKYLEKSFTKINIIETIEIFIFKLINNKFGKNFVKFLNFMKNNYKKRDLDYFTNFNFECKISKIYYSILDVDILNKNILYSFLKEKNGRFRKNSELSKLIIEASEPKIIELFYSIISNNLIVEYLEIDRSKLNKSLEIFNNFYKISKEILDKNILNINNIQSKILEFILNPNTFYNKVILKLGDNLNINRFEILLYSFRLVLSIQNKDNNFYSNFFNDNFNNFIKNNHIPGVCIKNDTFLEYYPIIVNHLNKGPLGYGCYVCSCGYYYAVGNCGWPTQKSICICGEYIGGENHKLVKRKGHMRLYKNQADLEHYNQTGQNRENANDSVMTIQQYKEKIIDKRPFNSYKGIFPEPQNSFLGERTDIRKMNILTYKIMHFILFSHLFFINCIGLLNDDNFKKEYCVENMSCIEILEADWNYIKEYLKENGGFIIQIYLHYIFEPLIQIFENSSSSFKTPELRNNFEKEVNDLLVSLNKKELYKKYESKYLEANKEANIDLKSTKNIILEFIGPDFYSVNNIYPCLKYFYFKKIPDKKDIFEKLKKIKDYSIKYPLLDIYLSEEGFEKLNLLQNLMDINNFVNILLNKYSFKISREDAKKIKISSIINENNKNKKLFEKYKKAWDNIKNYAIRYECRMEMPVLEISDKSPLCDFLVDNGELYHGMYLAAIYDMFIEWQNGILNNIINNNSQNGLLNSYINLLSRKVYIQEANENEILSLKEFNNNQIIDDILLKNIYRNCFERNKDNNHLTIDYSNYDKNKYDFDEMEVELGKLLLFGKKKFIIKEDDKNYLKFIIYRFEGFRNNKSSIIIDFKIKYKTRNLNQEEKEEIFNYLKGKKIMNEKQEIKKIKEIENMYFSLQTLIFYIYKENFEINEPIQKIIFQLPDFVVISVELKSLFNNNINFCVDSILNIFEYFESLCFSQIRSNLNEEYKAFIEHNMQKKIRKYYLQNKNGLILASNNFIDAIRKLISRDLSGKRSENEINENIKLKNYIIKEELWDRDPTSDEQLNKAIEDFFTKFDTNVGQSLSLYDCLSNNV